MSTDTPEQGRVERVRDLERLALSRLPAMQLANGLFCREMTDQPPRPSLRATIIVLIGLLRAEEHGIEHRFHPAALRSKLLSETGAPELTVGDLGLLLWAESRADGSAASELVGRLSSAIGQRGVEGIAGHELAWILIGLAETAARAQESAGERILAQARSELLERRRSASGLLLGHGRGPSRRFSDFATQIYGVLALSQLARLREDAPAREAARALGDRLLALQMPDGGWPWAFDARRGAIIDPYPILCEHQDAVAPLGLGGLAQVTGEGDREAALRGLDWIWGENELGIAMLDPETGAIYRSIRRRRLGRPYRYGRAAGSCLRGPRSRPNRRLLELDRSERPAQLGWILEAWAGREELAAGGEDPSAER